MPSLPRNFNTEIASVKRDPYMLLLGSRFLNPDDVLQGRGKGEYKAYDDLLRDGHCHSVMQKRYLAVIAREWSVEAASKDKLDQKAADMVKYHLQSLAARADDDDLLATGFDRTCYNLLDAILKGFKPAEILWGADGKEFYPNQVKTRNQQRFNFAINEAGKWELRMLTLEDMIDGEAVAKLHPRKFLTHICGATDDNPYGTGLGRTLWWNVFFKKQGIKFWLQFVDKFASPTAIGKYKRGATKEQKATLLEALEAIATDAGVAIPEDIDITLLEASRSGTINCYESLCKYMDSEMSKTVLGETLTTEIGSRGSYAAANTHNEVRKELTKADADLLSDTLNRTLIKWDVQLNLPDAKPPRLWRNFEEAEDLSGRSQRDKTLFDMGFKLKKESVTEIYGDYYEEVEQGGEASDEQFLINSGVQSNEGESGEETADMSETLEFGSIIDRVLKWNGLAIGVEFLPNQVRFPGRKHSKKLRSGYGHLRNYVGNDQEALDCYIYSGLLDEKPTGSDRIFQVTQVSPEDGDFDEHKFMLGYANLKAAKQAYLQEMPVDFFGSIQEVTVESLEQYKKSSPQSPIPSLSTSRSLPIATNFAEQDKDGVDLYATQLQERSAPIITNWIEQIRGLVEESESFEEVRDRLFGLFPKLNTTDFTELMAQAMMATEAGGRFEVIQETGTLEA
jgi:phage gp29-like protein